MRNLEDSRGFSRILGQSLKILKRITIGNGMLIGSITCQLESIAGFQPDPSRKSPPGCSCTGFLINLLIHSLPAPPSIQSTSTTIKSKDKTISNSSEIPSHPLEILSGSSYRPAHSPPISSLHPAIISDSMEQSPAV